MFRRLLLQEGDRAETFGKVLEFVSREVEVPQLCALTPFPGTALRRRLQREGRIAFPSGARLASFEERETIGREKRAAVGGDVQVVVLKPPYTARNAASSRGHQAIRFAAVTAY
jgi:hypothetical protein